MTKPHEPLNMFYLLNSLYDIQHYICDKSYDKAFDKALEVRNALREEIEYREKNKDDKPGI